jgi:hypothetical protein
MKSKIIKFLITSLIIFVVVHNSDWDEPDPKNPTEIEISIAKKTAKGWL